MPTTPKLPRKTTGKKVYTPEQLDVLKRDAFQRGYLEGRNSVNSDKLRLKTQQAEAITRLIEESGRVMSRAGYMLGKLNGDNSR